MDMPPPLTAAPGALVGMRLLPGSLAMPDAVMPPLVLFVDDAMRMEVGAARPPATELAPISVPTLLPPMPAPRLMLLPATVGGAAAGSMLLARGFSWRDDAVSLDCTSTPGRGASGMGPLPLRMPVGVNAADEADKMEAADTGALTDACELAAAGAVRCAVSPTATSCALNAATEGAAAPARRDTELTVERPAGAAPAGVLASDSAASEEAAAESRAHGAGL